ncbi:MAG: DUF5692 family protein [Lachnospiraceae bacterium]
MFLFNYDAGASKVGVVLVWFVVFAALFILNEISRRNKYCGFACFVVLPVVLSILWFTVLSDTAYTDWFHLAKVYSSTAGCIGFWCIRYLHGTNAKTGKEWRLADNKIALCFPPLILAINICEAVARDFQVGNLYAGQLTTVEESNQIQQLLGGSWNYMNAIAGILNILTIVGWLGICLRKETNKDKSKDMLWPGMMWFWIVAYDVWNFAYTYNCLPGHAWYCGLALLLAPTICAFTIGKGAWLQHRAHTLALWCMFAQTFPAFIDKGKYAVNSTNNETALFIVSFLALVINAAVFIFMIYKAVKRKCNPYTTELYDDMAKYKEIAELAE